ncbi:MAG: hypothetical protein GXC73_14450 [Chitinophagaceae bacterium]|nr:hypothetical protein [Chitinophagaceae bacterium]
MATFIFNSNQINFGNNSNGQFARPGDTGNQDLAFYIGSCLQRIPPKQLCRCLRESFLLRWEELQSSTPDFSELVTELTILLARLDAEEDRIVRNGSLFQD